jgi:hypothetical protein
MMYRQGVFRVHLDTDTGGFEKVFVVLVGMSKGQRPAGAVKYEARMLEHWQGRDLFNALCQIIDSAILAPMTDEEICRLAREEEDRCRKNELGI